MKWQKAKFLNALLIVTSLFGYLKWGGNNHSFLFQAETEIISKLFANPTSVIHPFTILPLSGQILLLITLFQKVPNGIITYIGICGLGILLAFMFVIGLIIMDFKIIFSTIPFLVTAFLTIQLHRKKID
jgi:hypothetical protein